MDFLEGKSVALGIMNLLSVENSVSIFLPRMYVKDLCHIDKTTIDSIIFGLLHNMFNNLIRSETVDEEEE